MPISNSAKHTNVSESENAAGKDMIYSNISREVPHQNRLRTGVTGKYKVYMYDWQANEGALQVITEPRG